PLGEDVEDQRGPVDHLDAERLGDVALLDGRERIVGHEQHGGGVARRLADLVDLAAAEEEPRRRRGPVLRDPAHDRAAGGGPPPPPALPATRRPGSGAARAGAAPRSPRARASPACWSRLASSEGAPSRECRRDPRGGAVDASRLLDVDPLDARLARE